MPRLPRLDSAGVLHHVIIRGIERRKIFVDDTDRDDFLARCGVIFPETSTSCYAFALLPNHAHLLLRTGTTSLSTVMARLLTGYAVRFNRVHKRHGQLFQNRYKSIVCQEDVYLRELVRYIHLNPVRAKIAESVATLAEYPYSAHSVIMGKAICSWLDDTCVISAFGTRETYLDFVVEGVARGKRPELTGGGLLRSHGGWTQVAKSPERLKGDVRILGDSKFVLTVLSHAQQKLDHRYRLKAMGIDFSFVEKRVLDIFHLSGDQLCSRSRQKQIAAAKALLCFWSVRELGMSQTQLSEQLGITQPGVASAVARGEELARERGYVLIMNEDRA